MCQTTQDQSYEDFIAAKMVEAPSTGLDVPIEDISEHLFPFQRVMVQWALRKGRAALFAAFGLGKTRVQLELMRILVRATGGRCLIVAPLGVRQEFTRDAAAMGISYTFVRSIEECDEEGIYLTNYETIRDGKLDPRLFTAVSLDEASCLRGFGATKTFRQFMALFEGGQVQFSFVATATPSPNEYIEMLAYAAFLDVMEVGEAKTRFFQRDSENADCLTLHPHKEREFWLWMSTWALFVTKPSDLGPEFSDEGYELPELEVHWHEIPTSHANAGTERSGQARLFKDASLGVVDAAREKRDSLAARVAKMMELRALDPSAHRLLWHDTEAEREAIEAAIPSVVSVYGSQDLEAREGAVVAFSDGEVQELATKPVLCGSGCNFQRHCWWGIYVGIGFKFNDWIQSVHRKHRFLQKHRVRIDLIYTEAERGVREALERKWEQHKTLVANMTSIVREYGLTRSALREELKGTLAVERAEERGERWTLYNNDCVLETRQMAADSVHLILTSIPFGNQYRYTTSFRDFGHTDDATHFFQQMDFLSPDLFRVLQPGRILAVHVKDRVQPGGLTGLSFQTVYEFHADCIKHYKAHGFAFMGMVTIATDVVRENNQTYRLGYTAMCKDGSRMGAGLPEYMLLFRKPQTDRSRGFADLPIKKDKAEYSLGRWQVEAAGFWRSSGDRLLTPEDLEGVSHDVMFKLFRGASLSQVHDHENHVALNEALAARGKLPVDFALLQPQAWDEHEDGSVWTSVARMRTLNGEQTAKGRQNHICPMQFDVADRIIGRYSMKGETVYDPFGGIGTVPLRAVKLGRLGVGCELNPVYHRAAVEYCRAAEREASIPTLFALDAIEAPGALPARTEPAIAPPTDPPPHTNIPAPPLAVTEPKRRRVRSSRAAAAE